MQRLQMEVGTALSLFDVLTTNRITFITNELQVLFSLRYCKLLNPKHCVIIEYNLPQPKSLIKHTLMIKKNARVI